MQSQAGIVLQKHCRFSCRRVQGHSDILMLDMQRNSTTFFLPQETNQSYGILFQKKIHLSYGFHVWTTGLVTEMLTGSLQSIFRCQSTAKDGLCSRLQCNTTVSQLWQELKVTTIARSSYTEVLGRLLESTPIRVSVFDDLGIGLKNLLCFSESVALNYVFCVFLVYNFKFCQAILFFNVYVFCMNALDFLYLL